MAVAIEIALKRVSSDLLKCLKLVLEQTILAARFTKQLNCLEKTLQSIKFNGSWRSSQVLDRPQKEITEFIVYMKKGKELVLKCSRVNNLNTNQKYFHLYKLIRLNNELLRFFMVDMEVKMMSTSMKSLSGVYDLANKMDQLSTAATYEFNQEPVELFVEIHSNNFPTWWTEHKAKPINAHSLSILTDEAFNSIWYDLNAPKVNVLTLNIRSKIYALPHFIKRMGQLRELSVTGFGVYPTQLHGLSSISYLSNLEIIRFEHVSISSSIQHIFALPNLQKLSFVMCEIGDAFMGCGIDSTITDLEFDRCSDLKELPSGICSLVNLRTLSITNCHELDGLPKALGNLLHLENLNLQCCTKLQELPESIGSLRNLTSIDISDCLSISVLPEAIGELSGLRVLKMSGCRGLQELPLSMSNLLQLEDVRCDEETSYLWMNFESDLYNLKVNVVEDNRIESFMKIIR